MGAAFPLVRLAAGASVATILRVRLSADLVTGFPSECELGPNLVIEDPATQQPC